MGASCETDAVFCMTNGTGLTCQTQMQTKLAYDTPWHLRTEPFFVAESVLLDNMFEIPVLVHPPFSWDGHPQRAWLRFRSCDH